VDSTLASLSLEEKAAQVVMAKSFGHFINAESGEYRRLVRLVRDRKIGGIAVFQGDVVEQAALLNSLQRLARVPLLVGADYERGTAMRVRRGTAFPDAMALGATRDPVLAERIGYAIGGEARAIGVHQNFAPVADVNNNPANPVINTRSFGEDADLVTAMVEAFIRGTNAAGVISTVKHFPGHGDTGVDSHLDLPVLPFGRDRLDSLELVPFRQAVRAGAMSVMIAHLEVPSLDPTPGLPATLSRRVVEDLLRRDLGFEGLVITDAMDMRGLAAGYASGEAAVRAFKAGADILLMPADEEAAIDALIRAARRGEITEERLNASVSRILMVKQWLHLDEEPQVSLSRIAEVVGAPAHLELARTAARAAVTLVRNDGGLLPLRHRGRARIFVAVVTDSDEYRTDIHRASSQLTNEPAGAYFLQQLRKRRNGVQTVRITPSTTPAELDSFLQSAAGADIVLVPLYTRVRSYAGRIGLPRSMEAAVARLNAAGRPMVVAAFGNPYALGAFPSAAAMLAAYSDAEVMVEAAVEALFGEIDVRGRLPVSIPGVAAAGTGVIQVKSELREDLPAAAGFSPDLPGRVDSLMRQAIADSAFPGAEVVVVRDGILVLNGAYGAETYARDARPVDTGTIFDIASLTKVVATTPAVMKLVDRGALTLDDTLGRFLPQAAALNPRATIRHLLTHTAGYPPFRRLWGGPDPPAAVMDSVLATAPVAAPGDSTIYSDIGMILLGRIVELAAGMPLDSFVTREFLEPLKMLNTTFRPSRALWSRIAPTELDTLWRKRLLRGTVHDENAEALGGVAGHAGLFSTAADLAVFLQMLMDGGTYGGERFLADTTVLRFTRRHSPASTRALGWDTRSVTGSTAGSLFSPSSFGHTGFTGTSVWCDPERDLIVVFLTNRVHPTRWNTRIARYRPALHDLIMQSLFEGPGAGRRTRR
jgi:beta-glucosidase-like glycosyl hydrolase/CubicO group peptidase (beta-lactamase class C family)